MGQFWTFGSYAGKERSIVDIESEIELYKSNLKHKIRNWKVAPQEIARLEKKLAKLRGGN